MVAQRHGLAIATATPGIALPNLHINGQGIVGFCCHSVEEEGDNDPDYKIFIET
jgi:hypothetical protein